MYVIYMSYITRINYIIGFWILDELFLNVIKLFHFFLCVFPEKYLLSDSRYKKDELKK